MNKGLLEYPERREFLLETGRAVAAVTGIAIGLNGCSGLTAETKNSFHAKNHSQLTGADMASEKIFDAGKVSINYLETGQLSGVPVVLFHGGAWRWQEYISLIPFLSEEHHVYALDLRGNGKSGWVKGQYRLEDFSGDGALFINNLKIPAVLVGHSIGGVVALMVAARCPEKVKAVIIEDSPLTVNNYENIIESSRDMFNMWLRLKTSVQSRDELSLALAREYGNYPGVTSQWLMFFAECLELLDPTFFNPLLYDFEGFTRGYDYQQILRQIRCPIMFLRGETRLGAIMTDEEINWLRDNIRNVSCAEIKGVGHLLHLQETGVIPVKEEMMAFLKLDDA
jgi:pimeloyl-ACP methyl ester carboxylesterase